MQRPSFDADKANSTSHAAAQELPWTGERLVPSQTGQIATEHLHRYAIACALAQGKDVLDIASGEGYGSALLGRTANSVVGVDIDSQSVLHASQKYGSSKIRFLCGDCRAIPLANASVDLVVSFETIEHIQQHDDFLDEVRRVLRKGGRLMVSTPDKQNYGDTLDRDNPFHVRELSFSEFRDVLSARFKHVRFLDQRFAAVSMVVGHDSGKPLKWEMLTGDYRGTEVSRKLVAPTYVLAVCGDGPLPPLPEGLFEFRGPPAHHVPQPELFAQVFGSDGSGYSEARSIKQAVVSGAWQTVRFERVERVHPDGPGRLRIDPVNAAAFLELASVRVIRDADKAVVYSALSATDFATAEFSGSVLAHEEDRRLVLLARDADPQIYLPPLDDFQGRSSFSVELTFRLETTLAGIIQRHHDLLMGHRELANTAERWRTQAVRLESAEVAWRESHADLRIALESSRVDAGRLESQLSLASSDATRLLGQVEEMDRSLARREEDWSRQRRESAAQMEELNRSLARSAEDSSRQQREFEAQAEESSRWQQRFEELSREAETVRRELHSLRESVSWRLTMPLRSVHRFLAKQRRSLRKRRAEVRELYVRAAVRLHPTRRLKDLRKLTKLVRRSDLLDQQWYCAEYKRLVPKTADPVLHYLRYGVALHCNPNPFFASRYYLETNPDVFAAGMNPLVHYILDGWREGRNPSPTFSVQQYLHANPDVAAAGLEPLAHYLRQQNRGAGSVVRQGDFGREYGMDDSVSASSDVSAGARALLPRAHSESDRSGARVVLVGHDAGDFGAQRLLLSIGTTLTRCFGVRIQFVLLHGGPLRTRYEAVGPFVVVPPDAPEQVSGVFAALTAQGFKQGIGNTTVSGKLVKSMKDAGFRVVSLVHELPGIIRSYQLEESVAAIGRCSDVVVFPGKLVRDGFRNLSGRITGREVIRPQGNYRAEISPDRAARTRIRAELKLPPDAKIVLNVGYGDLRKGFDLFTRTAKDLADRRQDIYFVWVGKREEGTRTEADGVDRDEGRMIAVGHREDVASYYAAADLFFLSSREDPYPAVVLEAMAAGLPVVGFAGATGCEELIATHGAVVPAADIPQAATIIDALLNLPEAARRNAAEARIAEIRTHYDFKDYCFWLLQQLDPSLRRVSVLVPNYNHESYLPERLTSIFQQRYPLYEVIVLDDASTDRSLPVIERIADCGDRDIIVIANASNSGSIARQWRKGLERCKGDYVWIAESDDVANTDLLAEAARVLERSGAGFCFTDSWQIDSDGNRISDSYIPYVDEIEPGTFNADLVMPGAEFLRRFLSVKNVILNMSSVVWRRDALAAALERAGAEIEEFKLAADWRLYAEACSLGIKVAYLPRALNGHRRHRGGVTSSLDREQHFDEVVRMQAWIARATNLDVATLRKAENHLQDIRRWLDLPTRGRHTNDEAATSSFGG